MQIRPRSTPRFAHQCNDLSLTNLFADPDQVFRIVRVTGRITIAVSDLDHFTVAIACCRPGNDAIGDRNNFGTLLTRKVDTAVIGRLARERICAATEIGGHPARLDRPALRVDTLAETLVHEHAFQNR